jgi:hypothetical protein
MPSSPSASPTPHDDVSGDALNDILPNYEVMDFIGRGGMGVV